MQTYRRILFLPFVPCFVFLGLCAVAQEQSSRPLGKDEVVNLLKREVSSERIEETARRAGISFEMTAEVEKELREAGATDSLIKALRELSLQLSFLTIEATPGDAQVFIDGDFVARTSPEGRLNVATQVTGVHKVRLWLEGYREYVQTVEFKPGQTVSVTAKLESLPPAQGPTLGPQQAPTLGPSAAPSLSGPRTSSTTDPRKLVAIRTVFIEAIDNALGEKLAEGLVRLGRFRVVAQRTEADAVLRGSCFDSHRLRAVHSEVFLNDRSTGASIWQDNVRVPFNPPPLVKAVDATAAAVLHHLSESISEAERRP